MFINRLNKVHLRKLIAIIGVFLFSLTLTACGSGNRLPNGNIDVNATYVRLGNHQITYGELWNELRFSSNDILTQVVDEFILEDYLKQIDEVLNSNPATRSETVQEQYDDFIKLLDEFALTGVFDVTEEVYAMLTPNERINRVEIFLANLRINNFRYIQMIQENPLNAISRSDILINPTDRDVTNREAVNFQRVHQFFYAELAQRLFAMDELQRQIEEHEEDEDNDPFHSNTAIVNRFREEHQHTGDVNAIIVPFVDQEEATNTLRSFGISVFNGQWFFIPGVEHDSWVDYVEYFDDLSIDIHNPSNEAIPLAGFSPVVILQLFAEMYNFIYGFRPQLDSGITHVINTVDRREVTNKILELYTSATPANPDVIIENILASDFVSFKRDGLEDLGGTALRNFVYRDLEPFVISEDSQRPEEGFGFFNPEPRTFTEQAFLIFKLTVEADEFSEDDVIGEDEDGNEIIVNDDLRNKIIDELNEEHITSTFIFNTMVDARNEISVRIFDRILEIAFSLENPDQSRTLGRAPDQNTMATISFRGNNRHLTVDEVFERLELTVGTTTSVDLLTRQFMKSTDRFRELYNSQSDRDDFLSSLNITLARFSNDEFASQGFPASMGTHNFMLMQFRTANVNDIINNFFIVNATTTHYINNFFDNDNLIDEFMNFTQRAAENFISFSGMSIFIHLDDDENGQADDIYQQTVNGLVDTNIDGQAINVLEDQKRYDDFIRLSDLLDEEITRRVKDSAASDTASVIRSIVDEFNSSGRHSHGFDTPGVDAEGNPLPFDPTQPESVWGEFRFMGIRLSIVELENISNTSDSSTIARPLLERAFDLFDDPNYGLVFNEEHLNLPFIDLEDRVLTHDGIHRLVITEASLAHDFTFTDESDLFEFFLNIPILRNGEIYELENLISENGEITRNQILLFIFENLNFNTSSFLPQDIMPAMNAFFSPVFERFTGETTQRELLVHFMEFRTDSTITFVDNEDRSAQFSEIRYLGQRLEDSFINEDNRFNNFFGWWERISTIFIAGGNTND